MNRVFSHGNSRIVRWLGPALAVFFALALFGGAVWGATPSTSNAGQVGAGAAASGPQAVPQATPGQDFEDVFPSNPFYAYLHNLAAAGVVAGYGCGGTNPPEPCGTPPLPYYRPNNAVTRLQMTKFIDLGRRNIADAVGTRLVLTNPLQVALVISSTTTDSIDASNASGAEAIQAICTRANQNCWAFYGSAATGDYAAVLSGGRGVSTSANDDTYSALNATANGATAYGGQFASDEYVSLYAKAPPTNNGFIQMRVDGVGGTLTAERIVNGGLDVQGNLTVSGSKSGYVVDAMQNADTAALEPGDVVVIVGSAAPVIGQIPVVTVKKATQAYDSAIAGIVDQVLYVPDAQTKAAYEAQDAAIQAALAARDRAIAAATTTNTKPDLSQIPVPLAKITDEQGNIHALADATQVGPGGYTNVVTLGAYKAVKADASFGAIHAGDLLTTSSHAGYAMKVTDKVAAMGAVIGKALSDLDSGTDTIPVLVTLK